MYKDFKIKVVHDPVSESSTNFYSDKAKKEMSDHAKNISLGNKSFRNVLFRLSMK